MDTAIWRGSPRLAAAVGVAVLLGAACAPRPGASGPAQAVNEPLARRGAELFTQFGCNTCHSTTGQRLIGPPLNGLYGKPVRLANGQTVTADEAYLRESILEPDAKIVEGYPAEVMASALADKMNQIRQDDNVAALVEYIKGLK
ncbi:MAG TPA: cytochrome c [Chloroflexota bacterium]|nr:cytochrome c [Chloroflexota bacterium]